MKFKKLSIIAFSLFYGFAGIIHFVTPGSYLPVIPAWLGDPLVINYLAGFVEIAVALLVLFKSTRVWASYLTIAMLLAFTISHVYFIQIGSCAGDLCIAPWIAWVRLLLIHPLLIYWAYHLSTESNQ